MQPCDEDEERNEGELEGSFQSSGIIGERGLGWHMGRLEEIQHDKECCDQVFSMALHLSTGKKDGGNYYNALKASMTPVSEARRD